MATPRFLPGDGSRPAWQGGLSVDDLRLIGTAAETEALARSVPDTGGVQVLPVLSGLGAPWWQPSVRAVVAGLTAAVGRPHVVRAALDGIAHRVADLVDAMAPAMAAPPHTLRVDGGLTANGYLMQRQSDLLGLRIGIASTEESTALGIAGLAAIGGGLLGPEEVAGANPIRLTLTPKLSAADRRAERDTWRRFVTAAAAL